MADSKQLRILKAMTSHLEGITPSNGYEFDMQGRVYRGVTKFGSDQETPFISILESLRPDPRPNEAGSERLQREDHWELLLQGWVDENRELPTDQLYQLKASMEKRLSEIISEGSAFYRYGGLITGARIGPGVVRAATPQPGGVEALYLPVTIRYSINLTDPFSS